ncbi:Suppressor of glycerol defect protein 1 [Escovopsis weberi]|uniref:Suppressor of glycerol defect protein 1 n=1 Tax=Escovopsis weberi TaxID=150374 RepID=A0A0M9VSJ0_ESCWE|nr:Suppressor of glycerol defect protein 1 [Escovopsis weberi]
MPAPTAVTELQQKLFKRIGVDFPERQQPRQQARQHRGSRAPLSGPQSRKLQRKNQRAQKKSDRYKGWKALESEEEEEEEEEDFEVSLDEDEAEVNSDLEGLDDEEEDDDDIDDDDDDDDGASDDHGEQSSDETAGSKRISSAMRQRLAQDDAEIDEFERKLGIKKKSKSLPQAFKDDGLAELLGELGGDISEEGGDDDESLKRKRDYDDWLAAKRRKTNSTSRQEAIIDDNDDDDDEEADGLDESENLDDDEGDDHDDNDDEEDVLDDEAFEGFGSEDDGAQLQQTRAKENPYKAPTTGNVVAKYVPPSLRKAQGSVSEARSRLQRQLQGQINRLTEANILSIVQAIDELYSSNARGDVTELLTIIILAQMQSPDSLSDQFFVLTGGFSAAIYKVIGSSFGSHLVREVARAFGQVYETCHKEEGDPAAIRKEATNMIAFLSQLYLFDVVGCKIIFDYMERFLENLSELNVELLLRICRAAGQSLRKDDANALKHVTTILGAAVAKVGYANVSARTKFMIEMLNDLRNSKPKARGVDSSVVSDHVLRMRKRLGELKSRSRRLDGLAPMGVGLADIEQADTAGKWWLVGASVPAKEGKKGSSSSSSASARACPAPEEEEEEEEEEEPADPTDDEDMDFVLPDYPKKARDQGLTTTAQIAIFTAVMSAMNYEHGYQRYVTLGLKRDDQLEVARVLVQCVGSEAQYNEYYALVGKKACANARVRFAFQDRLWRIFRSLGESLFGGGAEADAEETAESERMRDERRMAHVARFYASLVADGALAISVLKPLNFPEMNRWTALFVECFVAGLLRACRACKGPAARDAQVHKLFGPAADVPSLSAGLAWFLGGKFRKAQSISAEEMKKLDKVIKKARAAVRGASLAQVS